MFGNPWKVLALTLVAAPTVSVAQTVVDTLPAPALVGEEPSHSVFHSVSAPEVIATPVNQGGRFQGPSPAGPAYAGQGAELMPPLNIPLSKLKCCQGDPQGRPCRVDRYRTKPAGINPDCLICVKEPYTTTEEVVEQVEVVVHQCFQTEVPFADDGCEDGTWYKKQGKKIIRRLRPCTVLVDVRYDKKVVRYQDVWYHVRCD